MSCCAPNLDISSLSYFISKQPFFLGVSDIKGSIGPKKVCGPNQTIAEEDERIPPDNYFHACRICYCTCDDNTGFVDPRNSQYFNHVPTNRFVYKKAVMSNVRDHCVITGAFLVQSSGVIYIVIKQGKLLNEGLIDENALNSTWITEPENDLYNPENHFELEWSKRSVELQDINVPPGHVLVGLQLVSSNLGVKLRVLSMPYDFNRGRIINPSNRPTSSHGKKIRSTIDLDDLNMPDAKTASSDVLTNRAISFGTSNFMSDIGQNTIPFLDRQYVQSKIETPMGGAGLYYKYKPGYSGYLGIKLLSYDVSQNLKIYDASHNVNFSVLSLSKGDSGIFIKNS